jgi:hypothetical protein
LCRYPKPAQPGKALEISIAEFCRHFEFSSGFIRCVRVIIRLIGLLMSRTWIVHHLARCAVWVVAGDLDGPVPRIWHHPRVIMPPAGRLLTPHCINGKSTVAGVLLLIGIAMRDLGRSISIRHRIWRSGGSRPVTPVHAGPVRPRQPFDFIAHRCGIEVLWF